MTVSGARPVVGLACSSTVGGPPSLLTTIEVATTSPAGTAAVAVAMFCPVVSGTSAAAKTSPLTTAVTPFTLTPTFAGPAIVPRTVTRSARIVAPAVGSEITREIAGGASMAVTSTVLGSLGNSPSRAFAPGAGGEVPHHPRSRRTIRRTRSAGGSSRVPRAEPPRKGRPWARQSGSDPFRHHGRGDGVLDRRPCERRPGRRPEAPCRKRHRSHARRGRGERSRRALRRSRLTANSCRSSRMV